MTDRNVWESEARAIVSALDKELVGIGRAEDIIEQLRSSSEVFWRVLANAHGLRTPSAITIESVLLTLEARAEEDARCEPSPELSADIDNAFDQLDAAAMDERWEE